MHYGILAAATAAIVTLSIPAEAQVTYGKSLALARAEGGFDGITHSAPVASTTVTALPSDPVSVTNAFADADGRSTFAASSSALAEFIDAAHGDLNFTASADVSVPVGTQVAQAFAIGASYYQFTVASASIFNYTYSVERSGNDTFLPSAYIRLTQRDASDNIIDSLLNQSGFTGNGSGSYLLGVGKYRIDFSNNVNPASVFADTGTVGESISGRLDFSIDAAAVPEPESWAMMAGGFGLAGAALRRRRKVGAKVVPA